MPKKESTETGRRRAAGLARISTDLQNQPYSLESQCTRIEFYARSQGWDLVEMLSEEVSGAAEVRPSLDRLMDLARSGKIDVLIVTKVDRLSRTIRGLM